MKRRDKSRRLRSLRVLLLILMGHRSATPLPKCRVSRLASLNTWVKRPPRRLLEKAVVLNWVLSGRCWEYYYWRGHGVACWACTSPTKWGPSRFRRRHDDIQHTNTPWYCSLPPPPVCASPCTPYGVSQKLVFCSSHIGQVAIVRQLTPSLHIGGACTRLLDTTYRQEEYP